MRYTARLTGSVDIVADTLDEARARVEGLRRLKQPLQFRMFLQAGPFLAKVRVDPPDDDAVRTAYISAAEARYASDDIEIDDDARISESDHGAFVQAWVHVRREDAGLDDEGDAA